MPYQKFIRTILLSSLMLAGCQSQQPPAAQPPADLKSLDLVRASIISVDSRLNATLESADNISGTASLLQQRKDVYSDNLRSTQSAWLTLTSDAATLKERADEYLLLWSQQSVTFDQAGHGSTMTNDRWQASKAKYDDIVASLQQARDQMPAVMATMDKLQADFSNLNDTPQATVESDLREAQRLGGRTSALLNGAVGRIDELKTVLSAPTSPKPG